MRRICVQPMFGEHVVGTIVDDIPHLCGIDGEVLMSEDVVGALRVDDGLNIVLSFSPVSQCGTTLPGIAICLRLFCCHNLVSACSHDYSPHSLFPHGVFVLGQLRDVAVNAVESFGRHCAGVWCFQGFEGLVRAGGRRFRGSW